MAQHDFYGCVPSKLNFEVVLRLFTCIFVICKINVRSMLETDNHQNAPTFAILFFFCSNT